ncbi:unnamed protein product [Durusdinium trenchii]|uniref:Uncharacterized protein n=1 Tax=Durusdinium trenchii TaxID=1381693 RepID=A0ABP0JV65_9DINO
MPKRRRRLLRRRLSGSAKEKEMAEKKKKEAEAKAKAKAKARARRSAPLCGAKPPLRLSFRQWARWLLSLELLPPKLQLCAATLAAPKPVAPQVPVAPPDAPRDVAQQRTDPVPTPAFAQSPTQSEETPESPERGATISQPLLAS